MLLDRPKSVLQLSPYAQRTEDKALAYLKLACERSQLASPPLPIPVEEWIELVFGYEYGVEDFRVLYGVDAVGGCWHPQAKRGGVGRIAVDVRTTDPGFRRFTCAHELGHMLLHGRVRKEFIDQYVMEERGGDPHERQANQFAAGFLMPVPLLLPELLDILDQCPLGRVHGMHLAHSETPQSELLWREVLVPALLAAFGVSLTAMLRRLTELHLTNRQPLMPLAIAESIRADPAGHPIPLD